MKAQFLLALGVFLLFGLLAFFGFVSAGDVSVFQVDLMGPAAPVIGISVPDIVDFGALANGEETDNIKMYINNTGNVGIIITPRLVNSSENVFNYTYFQRRTTESYSKIGSFSFNISAPATTGGIRSDYVYAKLDLKNYNGNFTSTIYNYNASIRFFAVSQ